MADKYEPYILPPCPEEPDEPSVDPTPSPCADWSICLPFGGQLYSRNGCVFAERGQPPADGVYGKIVIANGCIVGVEPVEALVDNIAVCASNPSPCSETASVEPSKSSGNLYALDATGKPLVRCTIKAGSGVAVSGDGTATNPYIVSASEIAVQSIYITSGNDAITVSGAGTYSNPFTVAHKTGMQTLVNGMTFDKYGHLVDTGSTSANAGISAVIGGMGIDVQTDNNAGMATVSLQKPTRNKAGTYVIGGWELDLDEYNRIFNITRDITLEAGVYAFGLYDVQVNSTGSITALALNETGLGSGFVFNWPAGSTPTSRNATFTLRYPTALSGVLYTDMEIEFWKGLSITLDGVSATLPKLGETPPAAIPFWAFGLFSAGQHSIKISSTTAWVETSGAVVQLYAVTGPDALSEQ